MEQGTATTRLDPETGERFKRLRAELGVSAFGLNQIVLQPGQRGRVHRHERQEEVYVVLEGTLDLLVDGEEHTLEQGDLMRVAPDLRRQLVNRGPGRVVLLALGGAGEHEGRDGVAYADWEATEGVAPQEMAMPDDLPAGELRA
ncbi:MAG: hypothetical protein QOF29_2826 [bacterium]|jgi:uncharacterized cupin superfamily protein